MTVVLYGASDDLIEVDGDIYEEFNYLKNDDAEGAVIGFSDGTILRIKYEASGVWRITPVARGTAELDIVQAPEDDGEVYSDKATLTGDVSWAVHGVAYAKSKVSAEVL